MPSHNAVHRMLPSIETETVGVSIIVSDISDSNVSSIDLTS